MGRPPKTASVQAGPTMPRPEVQEGPELQKMKGKPKLRGWCRFQAKIKCYIENVTIEQGGQEITLSPAASHRVRQNKNLILVEGEFPETKMVQKIDGVGKPMFDAKKNPVMICVPEDDDLLEGDPILSAPTPDFRMLKPEGAAHASV